MSGTRYIVAGSLIDGSGAAARKNVFLKVVGATIAAIGPVEALPPLAGADLDDFSHCVIVPALVDCSVSLASSPAVASQRAGQDDEAAMLSRHLAYCHAHGVLGLADTGDPPGLAHRLGEALAGSGVVAVRVAGDAAPRSEDCPGDCGAGGDFIKINYSENIDAVPGPLSRPSPESLGRDLARKGGRKAVVVANGQQEVAEALAAGADAIEQGYGMGTENLRIMADREVLWIPSLLRAKNALDGASGGGDVCCRFSTRYVAPGKPLPGAEALWKKTLAEQLAQLGLARELGVRTAVGTGAGSVGILHGESAAEEMKLFLKAGYTLEESIRCASVQGAGFFGMEALGMLAPGRQATFLIVRGTVQQLRRKLSYLEGIYIGGAPSPAYRKNPVRSA
ncbi:MAG: amidohydrolase family protein [Thermodesulfobacteriota bacterium]